MAATATSWTVTGHWDRRGEEGPAAPPALAFRGRFSTPLLPSEQLTQERLTAPVPASLPGSSVPRQHSGPQGRRGSGRGEWEPLFVSTEKVLTRFRSHRHGNRPWR